MSIWLKSNEISLYYYGDNVTATRFHYAVVLVEKKGFQGFQLVDTKNNTVLYENEDEQSCLEKLIQLTGFETEDDKKLIASFK